MPTTPAAAPRLVQSDATLGDYRERLLRICVLAGLSGCPQLSVPCSSHGGAPLGLSLLGPRGSDALLVRLAARLAPPAAATLPAAVGRHAAARL